MSDSVDSLRKALVEARARHEQQSARALALLREKDLEIEALKSPPPTPARHDLGEPALAARRVAVNANLRRTCAAANAQLDEAAGPPRDDAFLLLPPPPPPLVR